MEIVAAELDIIQSTLYNITVSQILRHHGIFSGESTPKLARALLLLNKVCFHAGLLSFKGDRRLDYVHGLRSAAQLTGQASSTEVYPTTDTHTTSYDSNNSIHNNLSYNTSNTIGSSTGMAGNNSYWASMSNLSSTATNPTTGMHPLNGSGSAGPTSSSAVGLSVSGFHCSSSLRGGTASGAAFRGGVFVPGRAAAVHSSGIDRRTVDSGGNNSGSSSRDYSDVGVELGCCKLQSLQRLLRRFSGLKVAVLLQSIEELALVKELLNQQKTQYFIAFQRENDQICPNLWCEAQDSVENFNNPDTSSGLLLCSKHVFLSPNIPPHQADAVIVLSDDWLRSTDVKDCFRLRLLNAGPTGPPLTVVRVVAGGTVEERMARKGASFLQLQGSPVTQLYPALSELLTTSTSSPAMISSSSTPSALHQPLQRSVSAIEQPIGSSSEQHLLLYKAPMLVQPPALHKSQSANVLLNGSSAEQLLPLSQTSMSVGGSNQENTNTAKSNPSEQGGRGKGKGFIVLGKQGATTFVKDHNTMQSLGLARARAGIASALSGHPSTDPLLQPLAQKWLQRLRADLKLAEQDFDRRKEAILITSESDMILHRSSSRSLAVHRTGHANNDSIAKEDITTLQGGECVNSSIVSSDDVAILLSRRVIHENLHSYAVGNASKRIHHGTHKFKLICQVIINILNTTKEGEQQMSISGGFSELEYRRMTDYGLGRTEPERCFGKLIAPYRADTVTPPVDPAKVKSDSEGSQSWAKSFFVFRDLLVEARREGVEIDTRLVVNPLLSACRSDTISTQSYLQNHQAGKTEVFIRYLQGNGRSSNGASRSSKPRRSRPSGSSSRRKDPSTGTTGNSTTAKQTSSAGDSESQQNDVNMHERETGSFEVGFLSDLEPSGDTPKKPCKGNT